MTGHFGLWMAAAEGCAAGHDRRRPDPLDVWAAAAFRHRSGPRGRGERLRAASERDSFNRSGSGSRPRPAVRFDLATGKLAEVR
ncbi:hypothetical protein [Amycolatopsis orientalis]|uniref:hypothetical protein n=1 Tax=Amycolatopsis orientalis TaxID=31958 RepID=UPI00131A4562|nr:hypothetical protein [Amycolatopsis orientalis]